MIRIVAYNVGTERDVRAAGEVLAALHPTVVCVLEAPPAARLKRLARPAALEVAARFGRRGNGTAVLVAPHLHVLATAGVPLTTSRDVPRREATHAIVSIEGTRLSVTALQLGLRPEVRRRNLDELTGMLDSVEALTVVGCDLNESPRAPVAVALAARYQDAHATAGVGSGLTYPTADLSTRRDFVFVDQRLRVRRCFSPTQPPVEVASQHRPVVVDLELPGADGDDQDAHPRERRRVVGDHGTVSGSRRSPRAFGSGATPSSDATPGLGPSHHAGHPANAQGRS